MAKKAATRKKKRSVKKKKTNIPRANAKPSVPPEVAAENKIAVFRVGEEMFAFHLDVIMETLYSFALKPVEHLPEIYKGIISFRKKSVPVVSLLELFKLESAGSDDPVCVIVAMRGEHMGFLVDTDIDIIPESMGQRHPLPDCYTLEEAEFIEGIFWLDQRFIGILNPLRMMEVLVGWRKGNENK
jgi:chemotaxis signal transduction protein